MGKTGGGTHLGVYVAGLGGIKTTVSETLILRCPLGIPADIKLAAGFRSLLLRGEIWVLSSL